MCRVFMLHRNGFYAWLSNPVSVRAQEDQRLLKQIVKLFPPDEYQIEIAAARLNWHYKTLEDAFRVKWLLENFVFFQIRMKR